MFLTLDLSPIKSPRIGKLTKYKAPQSPRPTFRHCSAFRNWQIMLLLVTEDAARLVVRHRLALQVREYMVALEGHLGEAHRQAQRLLKRQADLGAAMAEFGAAMATLGQAEQPHLASALSRLGDKAAAVSAASQVRCTPACARVDHAGSNEPVSGPVFVPGLLHGA